jgi:DNA-binding MarR family transcriptional regulator
MKLLDAFEQLSRSEWRKKPMLGIKGSEVRVLLCIDRLNHESHPLITVSEISRRLSVTSPSVTEFIKNLSSKGYVVRCVDSNDKRVVDIKLTDKGEKIVQKINNYFTALFSGLIERLGQEQSNILIELLDQVNEYLNEVDIEID